MSCSILNQRFRQGTLDGLLVPKIPQFTKVGLVDHLIELIVCGDNVSTTYTLAMGGILTRCAIVQAIRVVDTAPFRRLLKYLRPSLAETDIPHRKKTKDEIDVRAVLAVDRLAEALSVCLYFQFICMLELNHRITEN